MPRPYHKVLLEAVARSLRRGLDLHVSTVERLCRELGLELRSVARTLAPCLAPAQFL